MGIRERITSFFQGAKAAVERAIYPFQLVPEFIRYAFTQITFRNLVNDGLKGNGVVYACISALALAFPEPKLRVLLETKTGYEKLTPHPLTELLKKPNPNMGLAQLLMYTIVYMALGGNAYWLKIRSRAGKVVQIWPLHDGQVEPIAGGTQLVKEYEFDNGNGQIIKIPPEDIVHFRWMVDPLSPWKGLAPLVAVAREVDADNEATRYTYSLLKNDAVPRLALVVPEDADLDDDKRKRLKREWSQEYGGENRGLVALLYGGLDVKTIASNLKEMDFTFMRRVTEARLCGAFRVPPMIAMVTIGIENATYSNFREARLMFVESTLVPLWGMVDDEITRSLLPEFTTGANESAEFDMSTVVALQEKQATSRQWALQAVADGAILLNEFRKEYGLTPDPAGDVYLRGPAVQVVKFGELPPPPPQKDDLSHELARIGTNGASEGEDERVTEEDSKGAPHYHYYNTTATSALEGDWQTLATDVAQMRALLQEVNAEKRAEIEQRAADGARVELKKTRDLLQEAVLKAQQRTRNAVATQMESALEKYYDRLADKVYSRLRASKAFEPRIDTNEHEGVPEETKVVLPSADSLFEPEDSAELKDLLRSFYLQVIQESWDTWGLVAGGLYTPFDPEDPTVTKALESAGQRVRMIDEKTLAALNAVLKHGSENGWGIDHLVRGDAENNIPGLKDVIEETYKNRARAIARTELGTAQNVAAVTRYAVAGVGFVRVLDDGFDNSDPCCKQLNGAVVPLDWAADHPLQHPNCVRAYAPEFDRTPTADDLARASRADKGNCA